MQILPLNEIIMRTLLRRQRVRCTNTPVQITSLTSRAIKGMDSVISMKPEIASMYKHCVVPWKAYNYLSYL